uniref:SigE family RNA polymerase sigma factor n=1 Tax=Herbidospora sakaeratensis TaxID=564415 RepID=UPI00078209B7|nr:SigE family RNA polymerase sigma factor [Herbidospora sakaeratensis]
MAADAEFIEYATAKTPWLRKVAYLLCGDWHQADDLVQAAITKLFVHWQRARRAGNLDGYARAVLVNEFLAERRRFWARWVVPWTGTDEAVAVQDLETALDLRTALDALPPRQRAAVVLRYYCDLSIEEAARTMRCSPGNVKSQASRGLATLRRNLERV